MAKRKPKERPRHGTRLYMPSGQVLDGSSMAIQHYLEDTPEVKPVASGKLSRETLVRQFVSKRKLPPVKQASLINISFPTGIHFAADDWLELESGMDFVTIRVKRGLGKKHRGRPQ